MAKLDLGAYQLELVLDKIWDDIGMFDYLLSITSCGVGLFAPWRRRAFPVRPRLQREACEVRALGARKNVQMTLQASASQVPR